MACRLRVDSGQVCIGPGRSPGRPGLTAGHVSFMVRSNVTVHQVAALKQLGAPGPGQSAWAALMARTRRKTPIVCTACHEHIPREPRHARGINRWRARCTERRTPSSEGGYLLLAETLSHFHPGCDGFITV
jgi:hypothetical protein